jgi:hypothetical protein
MPAGRPNRRRGRRETSPARLSERLINRGQAGDGLGCDDAAERGDADDGARLPGGVHVPEAMPLGWRCAALIAEAVVGVIDRPMPVPNWSGVRES